jgi:hypothetical protein
MSDFKCQFCGSEQLKYDTPYVELNSEGEYVPQTKFCCNAQKQNHRFVKRFPIEERPDPEEVGKWD